MSARCQCSNLRLYGAVLDRSSTQVALKAREVLISCQMPSYEERKGQMEAVLKASVTNSYYGEQKSDMKYVARSQSSSATLTLCY